LDAKKILDAGERDLIRGWDHSPILFVRGKGVKLVDSEGREYIDCTSQAWCMNVGFQHPKILKAASEQMQELAYLTVNFDTPIRVQLTERLRQLLPSGLDRFAFAPSGSDAVEGAIQIAMRYKRRQTVITLLHGYHGRTITTIAASYLKKSKENLERFMQGFVRLPNFYCYRCYFGLDYPECGVFCAHFIGKVLEDLGENIAGVIVEPVQGNGGQIPAPDGYFDILREICREHEILLLLDEVQTGFGRVGKMFAADLYNVVPDVIVLGKAMGSGFPIACTVTTKEFDSIRPGDYAFTHSAHPVSCAASLATIEVLREEKLPENAERMGRLITEGLKEIQGKSNIIGDVRGPGLDIGVELVEDRNTKRPAFEKAKAIQLLGLRRGILFGISGVGEELGNVIKIKPPLCIDEEEAKRVLEIFWQVTKEFS